MRRPDGMAEALRLGSVVQEGVRRKGVTDRHGAGDPSRVRFSGDDSGDKRG